MGPRCRVCLVCHKVLQDAKQYLLAAVLRRITIRREAKPVDGVLANRSRIVAVDPERGLFYPIFRSPSRGTGRRRETACGPA